MSTKSTVLAGTSSIPLALKPGVFLQVHDDGTLSVVQGEVTPLRNSSASSLGDMARGDLRTPATLPTSLPKVESSTRSPSRTSGIFPGLSRPIFGAAAGSLQGTFSTLNKFVEDKLHYAPSYTPIVLIGGGISIVRGRFSGYGESKKDAAAVTSENPQASASSTPSTPDLGGGGAFWGIANSGSALLSDTLKAASLLQDIIFLPVRCAAALSPLGSKVNGFVDLLTDESVSLAQLEEEIFTKNINNITKFTLLAVMGAGFVMMLCFVGAVVALVLGLSAIPVFCSLVLLLAFETRKGSQRERGRDAVLDSPSPLTPLPPPSEPAPVYRA